MQLVNVVFELGYNNPSHNQPDDHISRNQRRILQITLRIGERKRGSETGGYMYPPEKLAAFILQSPRHLINTCFLLAEVHRGLQSLVNHKD